MNPYLLPDGNVQIAFSGGRTSAYMLRQLLDANNGLPERSQIAFQNTGREMHETLDFVQAVGERWSAPIKWLEFRPKTPLDDWQFDAVAQAFGPIYAQRLADWWVPTPLGFGAVDHGSASRDGEPFIALIISRRFLPNVMARFCTTELKVRVAKRYLRTLGWERWTNCVGLRADEPKRLNKPPSKDRWTVWTPLAVAGVAKADVSAFWNQQPFDLMLPNVKGNCWLGNCDGCFLKSEAHVASFSREFPVRALWWESAEALAGLITRGVSAGRGAWFSKRYTRAEMRDFMDRQGDAMLSIDGALCQADDGECL